MYGNEKKNRVIWGIAAVCLAGLMVLAWNPVNPFHRGKTQIRAGVFSDSYWDVQNGNSYRILSDAISRFTQEHPEISVSFESGVIKDDYSEWLAEQIVKGSAPDIYFILSKDFNMLAETGADQIHIAIHRTLPDSSVANNRAIFYGGCLYPPEDRFPILDGSAVGALVRRAKE